MSVCALRSCQCVEKEIYLWCYCDERAVFRKITASFDTKRAGVTTFLYDQTITETKDGTCQYGCMISTNVYADVVLSIYHETFTGGI
jgi:hypothetical protein